MFTQIKNNIRNKQKYFTEEKFKVIMLYYLWDGQIKKLVRCAQHSGMLKYISNGSLKD